MRRSRTRRERIGKGTEIRALLSSAAKVEAGGLRMAHRTNGSAVTRMAVVVSRGCGGAVKRNREKRITREAWRSLKDRVAPGHDVVFVVHRFGAGLEERRLLMRKLIDRAGIA
jgi:ribonuclease P protein component